MKLANFLYISVLGGFGLLLGACSGSDDSLRTLDQEQTSCTAPAYNPSTAYTKGQKVTHAGVEYTAQYWTQGHDPASNSGSEGSGKPWTLGVICDPGVSSDAMGCTDPVWTSTSAYTRGTRVSLDGVVYQAHYWTQGQNPAQNAGVQSSGKPWLLVDVCKTTGDPVTAASLASALGFEEPNTHWTVSTAKLTESSDRTEGSMAGAVWGAGSFQIRSAPLPSLGDVGDTITYDLQIPESASSGTAGLTVILPSQGVRWEAPALTQLSELAPGEFTRLSFPLPAEIQSALRLSYSDLQLRIVVNGPTFETPYVVDNVNVGQKRTATLRDNPVSLTAALVHATGDRTVGEDTSSYPVQFEIPERFRVSQGNAGQGQAELKYRLGSGETTTCLFQGMTQASHPTSAVDVLRGLNYEFQSCSDGTVAGDEVYADWFALEVIGADVQDQADKTEISLDLGAGCSGSLPAAFEPHEVALLRDNFKWSAQNELPLEDALGRPTMWTGMIYVEREEQLEWLDRWGIFYSSRPLFGAEAEKYTGKCGAVEETTDFRGSLVYAIFPAHFYNLMGEAGEYAEQEGLEAPLRMVIPEHVGDPEIANPDGSLTYEALAEAEFHEWLAQRPLAQPGFGKWFKNVVSVIVTFPAKVLQTVATVLDAVLEAVQVGIGAVVSVVKGKIDLDIQLRVPNRGAGFNQANVERAWGPNAGNGGRPRIYPAGATVFVRQRALGVIPTITSGVIQGDGQVRVRPIKNLKGRKNEFCIKLDSHYAKITRHLLAVEVCDFPDVNLDFSTSQAVDIVVDHDFTHGMTQFRDSYDYSKAVIGYEPRKLRTLVGTYASIAATVAGDAFVTCLNFPSLTQATVAVAQAINPFKALNLPLNALQQTHMIMAGDSFDSRLVATHEYGHFVMCSMLYDEDGPDGLTGLLKYIMNYSETGEDRQMLESIADTFALQVTGGVNYPTGLPGMTASTEAGICTASPCLEANFNGDGPYPASAAFDNGMARWVTLFHDAFDRSDDSQRLQNLVSNSDYWMSSGSDLMFSPIGYIEWEDEVVNLPGSAWLTWIKKWRDRGSRATIENVVGGMHDAMEAHGYNWCDRCEVFAIHDLDSWSSTKQHHVPRSLAALRERYEACASSDFMSSMLGDPPGAPAQLDESCHACSADFQVAGLSATNSVCNDDGVEVSLSCLTQPFELSLQAIDGSGNGFGPEERELFDPADLPFYMEPHGFNLVEFAIGRGFTLLHNGTYRLKMTVDGETTEQVITMDPLCSSTMAPTCGTSCDCQGYVTVDVTGDAMIGNLVNAVANQLDQNYGNYARITATAWTHSGTPWTTRSVVSFVPPTLPLNSSASSANLLLFSTTDGTLDPAGNAHSQHSHNNAAILYHLDAPFNEHTVTWNNQPDVSEAERFDIPASSDPNQNYSIDITDWALAFYADETENNGFLLRLRDEQRYSSINLVSRDSGNVEKRPRVEFGYTCP